MRTELLTFGILLIATTGCNVVTLNEPLGEPLSAEIQQNLTGLWLTVPNETGVDQSVMYVDRATSGSLVVGFMEWDAKQEQYTCHNIETVATDIAGVKLLNTRKKEPKDATETRYTLWRFEQPAPDQLEVFIVDAEPFRAAITSGKLQGKIVQQDNKIGKTYEVQCESEALAEFLKTAEASKLLAMKDPLKLKRISHKTR